MYNRRRGSKKKAQERHALKRGFERVGAHIQRRDLTKLVSIIQNGGAKFIDKQSNRVSIFEIEYSKDQ